MVVSTPTEGGVWRNFAETQGRRFGFVHDYSCSGISVSNNRQWGFPSLSKKRPITDAWIFYIKSKQIIHRYHTGYITLLNGEKYLRNNPMEKCVPIES